MLLTTLGGAAASPNPGQGCSSYLVESDGVRILLDCGGNTLSVLREHTDFRSVDAILISHTHADHTLDLVPYRYGLKYAPGVSGRRIPLFLPPDGNAFLNRLALACASGQEDANDFFADVFDMTTYDPNEAIRIGPFRIQFHPTVHYVPCWAFRIENGEHTLTYLADTGPYAPLVNFARDSDLVICEATWVDPPATNPGAIIGHLTSRQAGEIASQAGARQLLLTHTWIETDPERHMIPGARETFDGPVMIARPGLQIQV